MVSQEEIRDLIAKATIKTEDVERLMKQCQIGVGGKDALNKAHNIMADCYGTLGALARERDQLQAELAKYRDAPVVAYLYLDTNGEECFGHPDGYWPEEYSKPLIVKQGE